jgi:hypothetical protein
LNGTAPPRPSDGVAAVLWVARGAAEAEAEAEVEVEAEGDDDAEANGEEYGDGAVGEGAGFPGEAATGAR